MKNRDPLIESVITLDTHASLLVMVSDRMIHSSSLFNPMSNPVLQ